MKKYVDERGWKYQVMPSRKEMAIMSWPGEETI